MSGNIESWIGRRVEARDVASVRETMGLAALLDHEAPPWRDGVVPPLGHWLYFPPAARQARIGVDGHPRQGEDLIPDTGLPRRMWAGSRIGFVDDIPLGSAIERRSQLVAARRRSGRSGELIFLTVRHDIMVEDRTALWEEQDIVYRAAPEPGAAAPSAEPAPAMARCRQIVPDTVRLFRFSALTFNGHRIHYDRPYAVDEEGYPGLVVQGPYVAILLMDHLLRSIPRARPRRFVFRGVAPLFEGETVTLGLEEQSGGYRLIASGADGRLATTAQVEL